MNESQRSFIDEDIDGVPVEPTGPEVIIRDPVDADYMAPYSHGQDPGSYDIERDPTDGDYANPSDGLGVFVDAMGIERDPIDADYVAPVQTEVATEDKPACKELKDVYRILQAKMFEIGCTGS